MLIATLLAAAAQGTKLLGSAAGSVEQGSVEKAQPLIDIDGTAFIQFAIFLVMAVVLYTTVFKPYFKVREERGKRIEGAKADARGMQETAQAIITDYETKLRQAKQRGAEERLKLRAEGQTYEREVLGQAREVGLQALKEAKANAVKQRDVARVALVAESQLIAKTIASRILGRAV